MKVGKTIRPFRYDLNLPPYDYTLGVTNRFKGLDLIDRVHEELWMEVHDIIQEAGIKTIPQKKECKKAKRFPEEALKIAENREEPRWQRSRRGDHFLSYKFIKRLTKRRTNFTEQLLITN